MKEIFRCVYGSRLFGTNTANSDEDFRSVVIPSRSDILLGKANKVVQTESRERANVAGDIDRTEITMQAFLRLLAEGDVTMIETFFAPPIFSEPEWDEVQRHKNVLITCDVSKFIGFSRSQLARFSVRGADVVAAEKVIAILKNERMPPYKNPEIMARLQELADTVPEVRIEAHPSHPTAPLLSISGRSMQLTAPGVDVRAVFAKMVDRAGERTRKAAENGGGVDWKGMYHAVRILCEAKELLITEGISFPLIDAPLLLKIRNAEMSLDHCVELCDSLINEIRELERKSTMPKSVNPETVNDLTVSFHENALGIPNIQNMTKDPEI